MAFGNIISVASFDKTECEAGGNCLPPMYVLPSSRLMLTIIFCLLCSKSLGFGSEAHKAITQIAESRLTDSSKQNIQQITLGRSLLELAIWPDRIRGQSEWRQSARWHYINSKDGEPFRIKAHTRNGNILSALNYYHQRLSDPSLDRQKRLQALAFFMHFTQDIHQPLHVGYQHDRGGNAVTVQWLNEKKPINLHWVWDTGLLTAVKKSSTQYFALLNKISDDEKKLWQDSTFTDWAMESKLLRVHAYQFNHPPNSQLPILDKAYVDKNQPVFERRLLMAGVRLANELNRIFDPDTVN